MRSPVFIMIVEVGEFYDIIIGLIQFEINFISSWSS